MFHERYFQEKKMTSHQLGDTTTKHTFVKGYVIKIWQGHLQVKNKNTTHSIKHMRKRSDHIHL